MDEKRLALLDRLATAVDAHAKLVMELARHAVFGSAGFAFLRTQVDEARREIEHAHADLHNHLRENLNRGATGASLSARVE